MLMPRQCVFAAAVCVTSMVIVMSGMFVRRALVLLTALALAGCGSVDTALRNSQNLNVEKLTLRGVLSAEFQRKVPTVIHFGFDKDTLDARAMRSVAAQAEWILAHPTVRFAVTGHTDRVGGDGYNYDLGMRRASRVVGALVELGVSEDRLIARVSEGETVNVIDTEARERANRRTVTEVIGFVEGPGQVAAAGAAAPLPQAPVTSPDGQPADVPGTTSSSDTPDGTSSSPTEGNNGHGNDGDAFDSSNPGKKSDRDSSDDDGAPGHSNK